MGQICRIKRRSFEQFSGLICRQQLYTRVPELGQFELVQASPGQVEVVGTTHSTDGVKRLVKSVVRGLKACQVGINAQAKQSDIRNETIQILKWYSLFIN